MRFTVPVLNFVYVTGLWESLDSSPIRMKSGSWLSPVLALRSVKTPNNLRVHLVNLNLFTRSFLAVSSHY